MASSPSTGTHASRKRPTTTVYSQKLSKRTSGPPVIPLRTVPETVYGRRLLQYALQFPGQSLSHTISEASYLPIHSPPLLSQPYLSIGLRVHHRVQLHISYNYTSRTTTHLVQLHIPYNYTSRTTTHLIQLHIPYNYSERLKQP